MFSCNLSIINLFLFSIFFKFLRLFASSGKEDTTNKSQRNRDSLVGRKSKKEKNNVLGSNNSSRSSRTGNSKYNQETMTNSNSNTSPTKGNILMIVKVYLNRNIVTKKSIIRFFPLVKVRQNSFYELCDSFLFVFYFVSINSFASGLNKIGLDRQVASYLAANPEFLEKYVLKNVELETLEKWTIRRARLSENQKPGNGGTRHLFFI